MALEALAEEKAPSVGGQDPDDIRTLKCLQTLRIVNAAFLSLIFWLRVRISSTVQYFGSFFHSWTGGCKCCREIRLGMSRHRRRRRVRELVDKPCLNRGRRAREIAEGAHIELLDDMMLAYTAEAERDIFDDFDVEEGVRTEYLSIYVQGLMDMRSRFA